MQDKTRQHMTRKRDQDTTIQGNVGQYKTMQYNNKPTQDKTMQTNNIHKKQSNTTQYNTTQDNIVQHVTKQANSNKTQQKTIMNTTRQDKHNTRNYMIESVGTKARQDNTTRIKKRQHNNNVTP